MGVEVTRLACRVSRWHSWHAGGGGDTLGMLGEQVAHLACWGWRWHAWHVGGRGDTLGIDIARYNRQTISIMY